MNGNVRCLMLASGLIVAGAQSGDAASYDYAHILDLSLYPAHVQAVHFANGNALDAAHSVTYGNWTVSFGTQPPVAKYIDNGIAQVQISGLVCSNSISGSNACGMSVSRDAPCLQSLSSEQPPIQVKCPDSVDLSP